LSTAKRKKKKKSKVARHSGSHLNPRLEGLWFKVSLDKKFMRPHLNQQNPGVVTCTCHPNYMGNTNRKIAIWAGLGINVGPYLGK
jgi:hypothetical protein